jgi:hypothetical protein
MKARYFTYSEKPKAVYYLTDIKGELYPNHSLEDFNKELETKWMVNPDIIIVDDRETSYSSGQVEMSQIEKYLDKLEQLKKQIEDLDDNDE